jgi:uncharacterized protein YheU (UPF0270 family)
MNRLSLHIVEEGYYAGTNPALQPAGSLARGSKNLLKLANNKTVAWKGVAAVGGFVGGRYMANTPNGSYASLGDKTTAGIGSIIGLIANALGFIGAGPLYITGVSRAVSASTALQFLLWKSGSYTGAGTGPITAGIDPPSAPTIAEVAADASTINSGTTSARLHFVRSSTGGRSRASTPSATLVVSGHKVRLTVQGADLTYASTQGVDRLGIDLTQWGFGFSGPHYEYSEIAISSLAVVDGVANSVELEWSSADVAFKPLAPIDDYPPPASVFAVSMEDVIAVIGCYGDASGISATNPGTAIAVSLPVFIESFPPDNLLFLPESPVGVLSRAADGFSFIGCKNSVHALLYTGGSPALSLRTIWPNTGVQAPHNMCLGDGGRLYAITAKRGLVRIGEKGEPETSWAEPVADIISGWTLTDAVLVWDNDHQCVVAAHHKTLLAFNVQTGKWSTELDGTGAVTGNICAGVTQDGGAIFSANDGIANISMYYFNQGSGTTWEAYLPSVPSQAIADEVQQILGMARFDNTSTVTVKVFTNGDTSSAKATKTFTPAGTGPQHLPPAKLRPNVRGAMSHQLYISQAGSGGDAGIDVLESLGVSSNII